MNTDQQYITYKFRVKDSNTSTLCKMASATNFVWNYCNEVSHRSISYNRKWLSGFDLNKLTIGCSKQLGINAQTIQSISESYAINRGIANKIKLSWRSGKKSLGWIPFKEEGIKIQNDSIIYYGHSLKIWKSRAIEGTIKFGSFNQDARGRWYCNITCMVDGKYKLKTNRIIGIDLGLKTMATLSNGGKLIGGNHYRRLASKLSCAQRSKKKKQIKTIHAKIANCRRDELHKFSTQLINQYDTIFIGDVSSLKLIKTHMAKSVLDVSWGMFRSMLSYKAIRLGVDLIETKENFSSVTCSTCGERSGPSGLSDLGVREWICSCGAHHDRDVNAAKNILRFGHESLKGAACAEMSKTSHGL